MNIYTYRLNTLNYKLNLQNKDMVSIYGFKDANYHPHEDHSDPFAHLHDYPFFS